MLAKIKFNVYQSLLILMMTFWYNLHLQGLKRPKNSCDVIGVILKELEIQSNSGKYRMLFAAKSVNGFFASKTNIRKPGGYIVSIFNLL